MQIKLVTTPLKLAISGFSGTAVNKNYVATAFALMNKVWPLIKSKGLPHKGLNIWVYEPGDKVFAGVELEDPSTQDTGLEQRSILLSNYAYYKHIGPYDQLKQAGENMRNELRKMGHQPTLPYIEIYGHYTPDETRLETELLMALDH